MENDALQKWLTCVSVCGVEENPTCHVIIHQPRIAPSGFESQMSQIVAHMAAADVDVTTLTIAYKQWHTH